MEKLFRTLWFLNSYEARHIGFAAKKDRPHRKIYVSIRP